MGRKASSDGTNKSQAIRDLLAENPKIAGPEAVEALKAKGIDIKVGLFYLVKGKSIGGRKRRKTSPTEASDAKVTVAASSGGALKTIQAIQKVAQEVGGMRILRAIVDALS